MKFFIYKGVFILIANFAFLVVGFLSPAHAQQHKSFSTSLNIKVDADPDIKADMTNYIAGSILSLGDVRLVDQNPEWQFFIVAEKTGNINIDKTTIAISLIITKPFDRKLFSSLIKEKYKDIFYNTADNLYELKSQIIYTAGRENLRQICEKIVSEFNARYIQPARVEYEITNHNMQKLGN